MSIGVKYDKLTKQYYARQSGSISTERINEINSNEDRIGCGAYSSENHSCSITGKSCDHCYRNSLEYDVF